MQSNTNISHFVCLLCFLACCIGIATGQTKIVYSITLNDVRYVLAKGNTVFAATTTDIYIYNLEQQDSGNWSHSLVGTVDTNGDIKDSVLYGEVGLFLTTNKAYAVHPNGSFISGNFDGLTLYGICAAQVSANDLQAWMLVRTSANRPFIYKLVLGNNNITSSTTKILAASDYVPAAIGCTSSTAYMATDSSNSNNQKRMYSYAFVSGNQNTVSSGSNSRFIDGLYASQSQKVYFVVDANDIYDVTKPGELTNGGLADSKRLAKMTFNQVYRRFYFYVTDTSVYTWLESCGSCAYDQLPNLPNQVNSLSVDSSSPLLYVAAANNVHLYDPLKATSFSVDGPTSLQAGQSAAFTIVAKDEKDNTRIFPETVTLGLKIGATARSLNCVWSRSLLNYGTSGLLTAAGTYDVSVNGIAQGSITVQAGPLNTTLSTSTSFATTVVAGSVNTVIATSKDDYGNVRPQEILTSTTSTDFSVDAPAELGASLSVDSSGALKITYTPTIIGVYTATLYLNGQVLKVGNVTVTPGAANELYSVVETPSNTGTVNQKYVYKVTAKDQYGNLITNSPDSQFSLTFPAGFTTTKVVGSDGIFTMEFFTTKSGGYWFYIVTVTTSKNVTNSPFFMEIKPGSVNSVATNVPSPLIAGQNYTYYVTVYDSYTNVIPQQVVTTTSTTDLTVTLTPPQSAPLLASNTNGSFSLNFQLTKSGSYNLAISYAANPLLGVDSNRTIVVNPGPPSGSASSVVRRPTSVVAGTASSISLVAYDDYTNQITTGLTSLFTYVRPTELNGTVSQVGKELELSFLSTKSGVYTVQAKIASSGLDIKYSPFNVTIIPATLKTISTSVGTALIAGQNYSYVVTAYDAYKNVIPQQVTGGATTTDLQVSLNSAEATVSLAALTNGSFSVTFRITKTGKYNLVISYPADPKAEADVTFTFVVNPGPPSAVLSSVTGPTTSVVAGTYFNITMRAYDEFSNLYTTGLSSVLTFVAPAEFGAVFIVDSSELVASCMCTRSGSYNASATVKATGANLVGSPLRVTIIPASPYASTSSITTLSSTLTVGITYNITTTARDIYSNLIPQTDPSTYIFSATPSPTHIRISYVPVSSTGAMVIQLSTNTSATSGSLYIYFNGVRFTIFSFVINPGPLNIGQSAVTFASNGTVGTNYTLYFTAKDQYLNPITANTPSLFNVQFSPLMNSTTTQSLLNGTFALTYFARTAGTYTQSISIVGQGEFPGSPKQFLLVPGLAVRENSKYSNINTTIYAGSQNYVTVTAYDMFGNIVPQTLKSSFESTNFYVLFTVFSLSIKSDGSLQIAYSVTKAQNATFTLYFYDGVTYLSIVSTTITILPGPVLCSGYKITAPKSIPAGSSAVTSISAFDRYGNPVSPQPLTTTYFQYAFSSPSKITSSLTNHQNGTFSVEYASDTSNMYNFTLSCTGDGTSTVIYGFQVLAGFPVVQNSSISPSSFPSVEVAYNYSFMFTARDKFGNILPHTVQGDLKTDYMEALFNPDNTMNYSLQILPSRNVSVSFYTYIAQPLVQLQVLLNVGLETWPLFKLYEFAVKPGPPALKTSAISLPGSDVSVGQMTYFYVTSRDTYSNTIYDIKNPSVVYTITFSSSNIKWSVTNLYAGNGTFQVGFSTTVMGIYNLVVKTSLFQFEETPFYFNVLPGYPTYDNSSISPAQLPHGVVGQTYTFILSGKDLYGNIVAQNLTSNTTTKHFEIAFYPALNFTLRLLTNGEVEISYSSFVSGNYTLLVYLTLAGGSEIILATSVFYEAPGNVNAYMSAISPPPVSGIVGNVYTFSVTSRDEYANPVLLSPLNSYVIQFLPDRFSNNKTELKNGTFYVDYLTTVTGNYSVSVEANGVGMQGSPYKFKIVAGLPSLKTSTITAIINGTAGFELVTKITGNDVYTNQIPQQILSAQNSTNFYIDFSPNLVNYTLYTDDDGSLFVKYFSTVAGNYLFIAKLDDQHMIGSPFSFYIRPDAIFGPKCTADGPALTGGSVTYVNYFYIRSADKYGNPIFTGNNNFEAVVIDPEKNYLSNNITDLKNGSYDVRFIPEIAGNYTIIVTLEDQPISGSPFSTFFVSVPQSVEPKYGPKSGNTEVMVFGSGFHSSGSLRCKFGDVVVSAEFSEADRAIKCISSSLSPSQNVNGSFVVVPMSISTDGVHFSDALMNFTYYDDPHVLSIMPRSGPVEGGTSVIITGLNFIYLPNITCAFGDVIVPALFSEAAGVLTCESPDITTKKRAEGVQTVPLEVSFNYQQYTSNNVSFFFYVTPSATSIFPPFGPTTGNTLVHLELDYIPACDAAAVEWWFGDQQVSLLAACNETSRTLNFVSPAGSQTQNATMRVSMNGQQWFFVDSQFSYYPEIITINSCPSNGPNNQDHQILVFGDNFIISEHARCRIQDSVGMTKDFVAQVVNSRIINCPITDRFRSGDARLSLSNNNYNFVGNLNFTFYGAASQLFIVKENGNHSDALTALTPFPTVEVQDVYGSRVYGIRGNIVVSARLVDATNASSSSAVARSSLEDDDDVGWQTDILLFNMAPIGDNAQATFSSLVVKGKRGHKYQLKFFVEAQKEIATISDVLVTTLGCPENTIFDEPTQTCSCVAGYSQKPETETCDICGNGNYSDSVGAKACLQCPFTMDTEGKRGSTSSAACVCAPGYFVDPDDTSKCLECKDGADCPGGRDLYLIFPQDGYWQAPWNKVEFFQCTDPDSCKNQTCKTGSKGVLCAVCEPGYAMVGFTCSYCVGNPGARWFVFVLSAIVIFIVVMFMIWKTVTGPRTERTIVLKILINFAQTLAFIGGFDQVWKHSKGLISMFQIFSSSNFSVSVFTITCAIQWNLYDKFVFYMVAPLIGCLLMVALFFVMYIVEARKLGTYLNFFKTQQWQYAKTTGLVFLFLIHPTLTQQIFQIFNCDDYAGSKFLAEDLSLSCDAPEYARYRNAAIAMVVLYILGIPALGFSFVFFNRFDLDSEEVQNKYRFLYEGYTHSAYFWEFVIIVRKVALVAIIVFLKSDAYRSVFTGIWLLAVALLVNIWVQPFQKSTLQLLETSTLTVLVGSLLLGMLSFAPEFDDRESEQITMSVIIITANVLMAAILIVCLSYQYYTVLSQSKYFKKAMDRFRMSSNMNDVVNRRGPIELEVREDNLKRSQDDMAYNMRGPITADAIKRGRNNYKLEFSDQSLADAGFGR